MDDLAERLAALEAAGWTLETNRPGTEVPIPNQPGHTREVGGFYSISRLWRGGVVHEAGETLAEVIDRAAWQQDRINKLEDTKPNVRTGLSTT